MSERDKKLLIYLGAIIIIAAAYFLVTRPFLDKYDKLKAENAQLENVLQEKRMAFEKHDLYLQGIEQSKEDITNILSKFPVENSDEKTIVFLSEAEKETNVWISQIKFAEIVENLIDNNETASEEEAAATQETVAQVEAAVSDEDNTGTDVSDAVMEEGTVDLSGYVGIDTEVGFNFFSTYDGFKRFVEHIRDYDERLVIKNIEAKYNKEKGIIETTMTLSQYAVDGPGRTAEAVEIDNVDLGRSDLFEDGMGTFLEDLTSLMGQVIGNILGDTATAVDGESYFIAVNGVVEGTAGKTIGRSNDPEGVSYITSTSNSDENVYFRLTGANGVYHASYELAGKTYEDKEFTKAAGGAVILNVMAKDRMGDDDDVEVSLYVTNEADIPIEIVVSADDSDKPRVDVVETAGDVIVSR